MRARESFLLAGGIAVFLLPLGCDCGGPAPATDAGQDPSIDQMPDVVDGDVDEAEDVAVDDAAKEPDVVLTCTSCHGSDDNPAPPLDTMGRSSTAEPAVGAHRTHLRAGSLFRPGQCTDCHVVPDMRSTT